MKQIKHRKYAYSIKTLIMNTLNSGRVKVTAHTWAIFFPKNRFVSFFDIL